MIIELPVMNEPTWLSNCSKDSIENDHFPLKNLLRDSLYYPSSGFDGDPVKFLGGNILSFIYIDYGNSQEEFQNALAKPGFRGYKPITSRTVTEHELAPNGWCPSIPSSSNGYIRAPSSSGERPFCQWTVFQRNKGLSEEHGPIRFSLLYLYADGVAAYQALYIANKSVPKAVAIIQPGHAFGGNWTDFTDHNEIFAKSILGNLKGIPDLILYGGIGPRKGYRNPCWPFYRNHISFVEKAGGGSIGIWSHR
jgi:hypothetical protein